MILLIVIAPLDSFPILLQKKGQRNRWPLKIHNILKIFIKKFKLGVGGKKKAASFSDSGHSTGLK
jgi:hypothetical protein